MATERARPSRKETDHAPENTARSVESKPQSTEDSKRCVFRGKRETEQEAGTRVGLEISICIGVHALREWESDRPRGKEGETETKPSKMGEKRERETACWPSSRVL